MFSKVGNSVERAAKTLMAILATVSFVLLGTGQAMAQSCPAGIVASLDNFKPQYELGEDIGIVLQLQTEFFRGQEPRYVDFRNFQYYLDCPQGSTTFADCTPPAGNTVLFDPDATSVTTDCLDTNGQPASPPKLKWSDNGIVVDFTVDDNNQDAIRLPSPDGQLDPPESCEVRFDIRVTELAPENQDRLILELTGWAGSDKAVCSNGTQSLESEASIGIQIANENAVFVVRKFFSDQNPEEVNVKIQCDTGIPLTNSFKITDPRTLQTFPYVAFVVYGIPSIGANCEIWEDPVPEGYKDTYQASAQPGAEGSAGLNEAGHCYFEDVFSGVFNCTITDTLKPTNVVVNKVWEGLQDPGDQVKPEAVADWTCYNVRVGPSAPLGQVSGTLLFEGETDSELIKPIYADYGGTSYCTVVEDDPFDSAVEADDSDCEKVSVAFNQTPAGSCTIYNTVFYEGIPTLSQYGMALMALLMLGIGLLGFRRFA